MGPGDRPDGGSGLAYDEDINETLTLTESDVTGFVRVCMYLWNGAGRGPSLDIEDVVDHGKVVTNFGSLTNRTSDVKELVGASADLHRSVPAASDIPPLSWIPVSERLPEPDVRVLVWVPDTHLIEGGRVWFGWLTSSAKGWRVHSWRPIEQQPSVTHWRPMSSPSRDPG